MKRALPMIGAAALVGAGIGGVAGHATVTGLRADAVVTERLAGAYGVPVRRSDDRLPAGEIVPAAATDEATQADCTDCSDFQVGYDWAMARDLRRLAACAIDSWSFQRGCEAAVRDRGYPAT